MPVGLQSKMSSHRLTSDYSAGDASKCTRPVSCTATPGTSAAWMKAARKHWNQAMLRLEALLWNWLLVDEDTILALRKSFTMLDFHMKSFIGSTAGSMAKRYCSEAECLRRTMESFSFPTQRAPDHKADMYIVAALRHLFVNRRVPNESMRLGLRFAAHIVRTASSEEELIEWSRFFHSNATYDDNAEQFERAIADLQSKICIEEAGVSAQHRRRSSSSSSKRTLVSSPAGSLVKSCFED
ncbi:hypothetical protein HGRIS_010457 [Hohenbuehelia grisea]|uniref:Uncharacterized protein n=1 Tax=Hohenbuehelia grisea TaxID=104357 RepID=A0ABR3IZI9_9AGAR